MNKDDMYVEDEYVYFEDTMEKDERRFFKLKTKSVKSHNLLIVADCIMRNVVRNGFTISDVVDNARQFYDNPEPSGILLEYGGDDEVSYYDIKELIERVVNQDEKLFEPFQYFYDRFLFPILIDMHEIDTETLSSAILPLYISIRHLVGQYCVFIELFTIAFDEAENLVDAMNNAYLKSGKNKLLKKCIELQRELLKYESLVFSDVSLAHMAIDIANEYDMVSYYFRECPLYDTDRFWWLSENDCGLPLKTLLLQNYITQNMDEIEDYQAVEKHINECKDCWLKVMEYEY